MSKVLVGMIYREEETLRSAILHSRATDDFQGTPIPTEPSPSVFTRPVPCKHTDGHPDTADIVTSPASHARSISGKYTPLHIDIPMAD
jgi:hypothetical protein